MRGVNKVILVGTLGKDPETLVFNDGGSITKVSIATNEAWTDKQTGQQHEKTEWHSIEFRGRLSDIASQYLHKGSKIYIEGKLRTDKWQDQNTGENRYATRIQAINLQMLDSQNQNQDPQYSPGYSNQGANQQQNQNNHGQAGNSYERAKHGGQSGQYNVPNQQRQTAPRQPRQPQQQQQQQNRIRPQQPNKVHAPPPNFDDFEDDIPF